MNSMGAHLNPVSFSIVYSESKEGIMSSYMATCRGLYTMYNSAVSCSNEECGFCTEIIHQMSNSKEPKKGAGWQQYLFTVDATNSHYQLDKPSSDSSAAYFATAKELFGADSKVGQCCFHLSSKI